jgi:hypothetical protein
MAQWASADEPPPIDEYIPTFTQANLYLHSNGSQIGNLDARDGKYLRWDATRPTAGQPAVYIGNNYDIYLDGNHNPAHNLTMEGNFSGDLDAIAFDLYFVGWAQTTIGCEVSLSFQLDIDGQEIMNQDYTGSAGIKWQKVDQTTNKARFALTNLWEASKQFELAYGPDVTHHVYLNIMNFYACNEFQWEYDSTAQPSDLIANLPDPGTKGYFEVDVLDPPPPSAAAEGFGRPLQAI